MAACWVRSTMKNISSNLFSRRSYSGKKILTMKEVIADLYEMTGGGQQWTPDQIDRMQSDKLIPLETKDVPPYKMNKSFGEAVIPMGTNLRLRNKYINHMGTVRFGRILEDLDAFSVWICFRHVIPESKPAGAAISVSIVTKLVDSINLSRKPVAADKDIRITGIVSWVGRSSMETTMSLNQLNEEDQWEELAVAKFVMSAREPFTKEALPVAKVIPETSEEIELYKTGEKNAQFRKQIDKASFLKSAPTSEEREGLHHMFLATLDPMDQSFKSRILPPGSRWMNETERRTTILCHPEDRNRFNKIFGGFIMRQAFELGWAAAFMYSRAKPQLIHVDDIYFRRPVDIGSVLMYSAWIAYTQENYIQVRVVADVIEPEHDNKRYTTNSFNFTFSLTGIEFRIPTVIPNTYSESMVYLDGIRHFKLAMQAAQERAEKGPFAGIFSSLLGKSKLA